MDYQLVKKIVLISLGWTLVVISPFVGVIPGPGGIPIAGAGFILILSQSTTAKRTFLRYHKRYPKAFGPVRRFLQRRKSNGNGNGQNQSG